MPTLNDMLKDMPQHYNFYLRGVMNSLLPEFMDPFDSEINERNVSGELLEALRLVVNDKYPNLEEGEVQSINYEDVQKFFKESSIFEQKVTSMDKESRTEPQRWAERCRTRILQGANRRNTQSTSKVRRQPKTS